jgi:uncharacterized membrane-anchored protein YhcB (DUF1043 family)
MGYVYLTTVACVLVIGICIGYMLARDNEPWSDD